MTNETPDREPSIETLKAAELIDAAESFLNNPLTSKVTKDDGSTERELSTARVAVTNLDPIELMSLETDTKTSYALTRWDGLQITLSTWSNDPNDPILIATPDKTGLLVSRPADSVLPILADIKRGSDRFETATAPKGRIKSVLGKLGSRRAA